MFIPGLSSWCPTSGAWWPSHCHFSQLCQEGILSVLVFPSLWLGAERPVFLPSSRVLEEGQEEARPLIYMWAELCFSQSH